ncbi:hypothetical protein [Kitasatospora sp. HPMI-4]|uniref:hypothetical protein n=1 Tax=Kitasatospora sp. HPMI-4 TaxID=3448443 RepID=UPI003F1DE887
MKAIPLFVLALLEIVFGVVAGCVALVGLVAELLARYTSAGAAALAGRLGVEPIAPRLRQELARLLFASMTTPAGGAR